MTRHPGGRTCAGMLHLAILGTIVAMLKPTNFRKVIRYVKTGEEL